MAGVGDRVQEVLDDAARAADEIRAEAQAASAAYLAERRREASVLAAEVADAIGRLKGADGDGGSIAAIAPPQAASAADLPEQAVLRATPFNHPFWILLGLGPALVTIASQLPDQTATAAKVAS